MTVDVYVETAPKRTFACAVEWPGWCRSGKTEGLALEGLARSSQRYARVAGAARLVVPPVRGIEDLRVVERIAGGATTEFGAPGGVPDVDRRPTSDGDAARDVTILEAAWATFDRVAAGAPAELRKGPRGGGRDRDRMVAHVREAEDAYANQIGIRGSWAADGGPGDGARRALLVAVLRVPSDGSALAGRRWTARYATRRIAWHVLDHAWEIEDRISGDRQDKSHSER